MFMNGMEVLGSNGVYSFLTEFGELKAQVMLPNQPNKLLDDFKCCEIISKALAIRWKIISPKKK